VGLALAACAVIAVIDGQDVLGLAAANFWTKLGFAIAGGAMLLNALMPRTTRRREIAPATTTTAAAPAGARAGGDVAAETPRRRRRFGRPAPDDGFVTDDHRTTVADGQGTRGTPPPA
jgi:hypothetical protein